MAVPKIDILAEDVIQTSPAPGELVRTVAISYQVVPLPPSVAFVPLAELPDWDWREKHRDAEGRLPALDKVPKDILAKGDEIRRRRILENMTARASPPARSL